MKKYSVIIPTFNSALTIELAIFSCINQTLHPYELIIIDDCSTDGTIQIIQDIYKRLETRTITRLLLTNTNTNSGPATARNLGWNIAKGDYITFLDSDDQWHPKKLEIINLILMKNMNIQVLGHCNYEISESINLKKKSISSIIVKNYFITPNIILSRDIKQRFDEKMRYTEDHDLLLRIAKSFPIYHLSGAGIPTELGRLPMTRGGLSGNRISMRKGELTMYKKFLINDLNSFCYLPFIIILIMLKLIKEIIQFNNQRA